MSGLLKPPKWLRPFNCIFFHFPNCPFLCPANWLRFTSTAGQALCSFPACLFQPDCPFPCSPPEGGSGFLETVLL